MKANKQDSERMKKSMNITGLFWILEAIIIIGLVIASFFFDFRK